MRNQNRLMSFLFPLAALMGLYVLLAVAVSLFVFEQPAPQVATLFKYLLSQLADWGEISFFKFALPTEWAGWILENYPDAPQTWPINDYHLLLDKLPHPLVYEVFPCYFFVAVAVSLFSLKMEEGKKDSIPEAKREDVYSRGIRRVTPEAFCKKIRKEVKDPAAVVATDGGQLVFSANRMREHMSVFGASGTGKSQFLLAFLSSFFAHRQKGTRVIIVDRKGEFYAHFREEGDIIYNPFDERSAKWSLFNELEIPEGFTRIPPDVWAIAKILFPPPKNADPFWQDAAAKVFCSAVVSCIREGKTSNQDLVDFCHQDWEAVVKAMKALPPGLDTGRIVSANPTTGGSILSTAQNGVQKLSVCPDGDFSIRQWLHSGRGNLYLSSAGRNDSVFIPILSLMIDLIGREMKEMPDGGAGGVRYLIVIDELAAYPAMKTLHYLVAEARSKGVAVVIATQTIQKMLKTYGGQDGKDIIANTKCKVLFKMGEEEDATYLSKTIGSAEIQRTQRSENKSTSLFSDKAGGQSKSKQIVQETVFLPSDIMTLPTGAAVVLHPCAGETVSKLQFELFQGKKRDIEFLPIQERTVGARDFAEVEKRRAEAKLKQENLERLQRRAEWEQSRIEREKAEKREREEKQKAKAEAQEKAAAQPEQAQPKKEYDDYLL